MSQMMPPDIAALLGGGGGAPAPGGGGGLPPDLAALMGGGGAPPEGEAPPSIVEGEHGGGEDALVVALDALQDAIDAEADQEDIQIMLKCQTQLQAILAKNQAEADAGLKGQVSPKAIRKQAPSAEGAY